MAVEKFPVEASHIMMFGRGVGDPNPIYYDEEYAGTTEMGRIIAPPTFTAAAIQFDREHRFRPVIDEPWLGSGKESTGKLDEDDRSLVGLMHAEQEFEYHQYPGPGDVLTLTVTPGKTWEKEGRRGGKLLFNEMVTEYRNQNDELMITARSVTVTTERPADAK